MVYATPNTAYAYKYILSSVLAKLINSMSTTLLEGLEASEGSRVPEDHPVKIQIKMKFGSMTLILKEID